MSALQPEQGRCKGDEPDSNSLLLPRLPAGLITEVTQEQQIALVEYIAHLTCEDWEAVSNDLVALGGGCRGKGGGG